MGPPNGSNFPGSLAAEVPSILYARTMNASVAANRIVALRMGLRLTALVAGFGLLDTALASYRRFVLFTQPPGDGKGWIAELTRTYLASGTGDVWTSWFLVGGLVALGLKAALFIAALRRGGKPDPLALLIILGLAGILGSARAWWITQSSSAEVATRQGTQALASLQVAHTIENTASLAISLLVLGVLLVGQAVAIARRTPASTSAPMPERD